MRRVARSRRVAGGSEPEAPPHEGRLAEPQPVVDDGGRRCGGIDEGADAAYRRRRRTTGELRGDDRPGRVAVAAGEFEAAEARTSPGLDERTDAPARLVVDDREVRHVGAQPRQMAGGWDDPVRRDHDEGGRRRRARLDPIAADHPVPELGEAPLEEGAERAVGVEQHRSGGFSGLTGLHLGLDLERRSEAREQPFDRGGRAAESAADDLERRATRAVPERAEEPVLERARIADDDARHFAAELELVGRTPDEGECRVDAR
ncbi:hypothetical protein GCM10009748_27690 [Agromyces lapidis]